MQLYEQLTVSRYCPRNIRPEAEACPCHSQQFVCVFAPPRILTMKALRHVTQVMMWLGPKRQS